MRRATWISDGETIEVMTVEDADGDFDVWRLGSLGDRDNWTTYTSELVSGRVELVFQ